METFKDLPGNITGERLRTSLSVSPEVALALKGYAQARRKTLRYVTEEVIREGLVKLHAIPGGAVFDIRPSRRPAHLRRRYR